jgi:hypothetical protein
MLNSIVTKEDENIHRLEGWVDSPPRGEGRGLIRLVRWTTLAGFIV